MLALQQGSRGSYRAILESKDRFSSESTCPDNTISDLHNAPGKNQTVFGPKLNVGKYLIEKANAGEVEYTAVSNGPFFDWGTFAFVYTQESEG